MSLRDGVNAWWTAGVAFGVATWLGYGFGILLGFLAGVLFRNVGGDGVASIGAAYIAVGVCVATVQAGIVWYWARNIAIFWWCTLLAYLLAALAVFPVIEGAEFVQRHLVRDDGPIFAVALFGHSTLLGGAIGVGQWYATRRLGTPVWWVAVNAGIYGMGAAWTCGSFLVAEKVIQHTHGYPRDSPMILVFGGLFVLGGTLLCAPLGASFYAMLRSWIARRAPHALVEAFS